MTINRNDLKIFKPELLGNVPEAGGQRTPIAVISGKVQELFTPISDIDHAQSAVNIVKCYPALDTTGTQKLVGAHVFINQPPVDPKVHIMMIESDLLNDSSRMGDMIDILESAVNPGQLINSGPGFIIYQNSFPRTFLTVVDANQLQSTTNLIVGQTICISTEYTGTENPDYPRRTHYAKVTNTYGEGATIEFDPPIPFSTPAGTVSINSQTNCTKLRRITEANALKYHGVSKLTGTAAAGAVVLNVTGTQQEIVPSVTVQESNTNLAPKPVTNLNLVHKYMALTATSATFYTFSPTDLLVGTNTLVPYLPVIFYTDSGGNLRSEATIDPNFGGAQPVRVTLSNQPLIGSKVMMGYLSAVSSGGYYANITQATVLAGNESVVRGTVNASCVVGAVRTTCYEKDDGLYIYNNAWILVGTINYLTGVITPASGSYTSFQYSALSETAASVSKTTVSFAITVPNAKLDTFYVRAFVGSTMYSGTSNNAGAITGSGVSGNIVNNYVTLTFSSAIDVRTISYDVNEIYKTLPPFDVFDIDPLRMPNNGLVDIFRKWGVVAVQHSNYQVVTSPAAGQVKSIRAGARFADITDANNASLWTLTNTHFTVDLVAGTVTINSSFPGFVAPFTLTDTIGELALVTGLTDTAVSIATGLTREYPINATVSSVIDLGDLQAYVGPVRDMVSWNNNWDNDGTAATANLNVASYPIEVANKGCINEDWVIIFITSTTFRLVGRNVGQIGGGDTLNDFIPMNTVIGQPYFIIRQEAFGGGWNAGEAIRFETFAAGKPVQLVRVVESGHSSITADRTIISFRGNEE